MVAYALGQNWPSYFLSISYCSFEKESKIRVSYMANTHTKLSFALTMASWRTITAEDLPRTVMMQMQTNHSLALDDI